VRSVASTVVAPPSSVVKCLWEGCSRCVRVDVGVGGVLGVGVGGVVLCRCVCVCDLLIVLP